MKMTLWALLILSLGTVPARAQGRILISNPQAQTHIGSSSGPLAGPGIWAQMFAGPTPDSLLPVGMSVEHSIFGVVYGGAVPVSGVPCDTLGYAQLVVWDGGLWGTAFQNVPADQRGATDIVGVYMNCSPYPIRAPFFTQPAIVPVPEPSVVALAIVALVLAAWRQRLRPRPG